MAAFATYDELKSGVASWLNRTDLSERIPEFISLGESRLNRALQLRMMVEKAPLILAGGATQVALPNGFIAPIALWAEGDRPLRYVEAGQAWSPGMVEWTVLGPNIEISSPSADDRGLTLEYRKGFSLSEAAPTNWLLTNHPDAYLFAALVEAAPYVRDMDGLAMWSARLQAAIDEINAKEGRVHALSTLTTSCGRMPGSGHGYSHGRRW